MRSEENLTMIGSINFNHSSHHVSKLGHTAINAHNATFPAHELTAPSQIPQNAIAGGLLGGGMSAFIFKPDDFSSENPILIARGFDAQGEPFEKEISIRDIDKRNASTVELFALEGYFGLSGGPTGMTRAAIVSMAEQNQLGINDIFKKFDFLSALEDIMDSQRFHGNLNGLLRNRTLFEFLLDFPNTQGTSWAK